MKDFETKKRKKMIERMVGESRLNFLESFMYFMLAVVVGSIIIVKIIFPVVQRAVDIEALNTCEMRGDCAEVIKDINKNK